MTVVIGMMADSRQPADPSIPASAYLLLCADTQATYTDIEGIPLTSHPSQGKMYELPHGFYAAFCDDYSWSHVVVTELHGRMLNLDMRSAAVRDLVKVEIVAAFDYAFTWYRADVLKKEVGITAEEYLHDTSLVPALRKKADLVLADMPVPAEIIVAGQTHLGPLLLQANASGVSETTNFYVSGRPSDAVINWLKFRDQTSNMSVPKSSFHMIEAKRFAQLDTSVGRKTQIRVIFPDGNGRTFQDDGVDAMSKWTKIFGIKDTEELDGEQAAKLFENNTGMPLPKPLRPGGSRQVP